MDITAEVFASPGTSAGAAAGLVFWADGRRDAETLFLIDALGGRFAIFKKDGGKLTPIVDWTRDQMLDAKNTKIGKAYRLEVVAGAKETDLLINGDYVGQIPTPPKRPGSLIGLYAAGSDSGAANYAFKVVTAHFPGSEPVAAVSTKSNLASAWDYINGSLSTPATAQQMIPTFDSPRLPLGVGPGQTLFTDDFKTLDRDWGTTNEDSYVKDGRFEFRVPAKMEVERYSNKYTLTDVDFGADVATVATTKAGSFAGLSLWADGSEDTQTLFLINPITGNFAINGEVADKITPILDWGSSPLIRIGIGETNRLEVIVAGKLARFLINGHQVAQMAVPSKLPGGLIGLFASSGDADRGDFAFSNFSAKMPVESSLPPGAMAAPPTAPGKSIFADDFKSLDPSWGVAGAASSVKDGRLTLTSAANDLVALVNGKYAYGEADVSASITQEPGGPSDAYYGLLFWAADDNDYVLFVMEPSVGAFAVFRQDLDKSTTLVDWTNTHALETAPGKTNRIGVALRKDKALLLINGRQVGELPKPTSPPGALVGVYVEAGAKAAATFDISDFSMTAPAGEGPPEGVTVEPSAGRYVASAAGPGTTPAPGGAPGAVIFSDDFKSLDPSWGQPSDSIFVQGNRLELRSKPGREIDLINAKHTYGRADISVNVTAEKGTSATGTEAGVLFWASDSGNYTLFDVDPVSSHFAVFRDRDGKSTTLLDWRETTLFDAGIGKTNQIGVALRADKAVLMINGHQAAVVPAPSSPAGALIGLEDTGGGSGPGNVGYTDLSVTQPAGGDLPPGTAPAAAEPGNVILADDFKSFDPSWGVSNGSAFVQDGKLELRSASDQEVVRLNNKYALGQAEVDASVVEEGDGKYGPLAGLLFWASDAYDYTLFAVDPISGKFAAFRETDDKSTTLSDWKSAPALNTGVGKSNRIGVMLQVDRAVLLVNGQQVGEVRMPASVPGRLVGLYGGGDKAPGSFGYSDFTVKALPEIGSAGSTGATQTASGQVSSQAQTSPQVSGAASEASALASAAAPSEGSTSPSSDTTAPQVPAASTDVPTMESAQPVPRAPAAGEQLALGDDFKDYDPTWGSPDKQVFVQDGRLMMQIPKQGFAYRMNGAYFYYDTDISFAAQVASSDSSESGVELIFWAQDTRNYYYLYVGASGRFHVMRLAGNKTTEVVATQSSPAIKTGPGRWNSIELLIRGKKAALAINGAKVADFSGTPPSLGGAIGLAGYSGGPGPSTLAFANLRVSVPKPVALRRGWSATWPVAPAPAPATEPGKIIAADDFASFDPSWGRPDGIVEVRGGVLAMESRNAGTAGILNYKYLYRDADIHVATMLVESAKADTTATLYFWVADRPGDLYMLSVSPLGYIRVAHRAGGKTEDVIKWQTTQALAQGTGKWNDIGVALRGGQGTVLVNGKAVGRFTGQPPSEGGLIGAGMLASKAGISVWDFGKLRVSSPADQAGQ